MQIQSDADRERMIMVKRDIIEEMRLQRRIGRVLRWGRKKKHFTMRQFATLIGVTEKELILIEQGRTSPPMCLIGRAMSHLYLEVHMRIEILMMELAALMKDEVPRRMTIH